ncbi:MAG: ATP-binding protein [Hyphomicrobiaceae bacterium]|nr:sensor histidine kinase [Hyphomicrobiaceae bacterium]
MWQKLDSVWRSWSLARQFAVAASLVLLPAMGFAGTWVGKLIEDGAMRRSAAAAALYLENFVEPAVQELATNVRLSEQNMQRLDAVLQDSSLKRRVLSIKLWGANGYILYSSRRELIGQTFEPTPSLRLAWLGQVSAEFDNLRDAENAGERALGMPIVEIYLPLRQRGSDRIIAVAEFYEDAEDLRRELTGAITKSRLMIAGLTLAMLGALFAIVRRGSRTIEVQRAALEGRIDDLTTLLGENQKLRQRLQLSSGRATEGTEVFLRRLGADLHDGPAQLIGVALLKIEDKPALLEGEAPQSETRVILQRALNELRHIAAGFAVPEIEHASLRSALATAVDRHIQVTGTAVGFEAVGLPAEVSAAVKLCLYRVVQEGLSNAYRHGGGVGQMVWAGVEGGRLVVHVTDTGPEKETEAQGVAMGLGIPGLTDRVESLGGTLDLARCPVSGTRLSVSLPLPLPLPSIQRQVVRL